MRVVLADDAAVLREGLARVLAGAGVEVVAQVDTADDLLAAVDGLVPDVAVVDIRMPPTLSNEGLVAAEEIAVRHPGMGVLLLSHYVEPSYALQLLRDGRGHVGYLLKDRVLDVDDFVAALARVAAVVWPAHSDALLHLAACGWIVAFLGFAIAFGPLLAGSRRRALAIMGVPVPAG